MTLVKVCPECKSINLEIMSHDTIWCLDCGTTFNYKDEKK